MKTRFDFELTAEFFVTLVGSESHSWSVDICDHGFHVMTWMQTVYPDIWRDVSLQWDKLATALKSIPLSEGMLAVRRDEAVAKIEEMRKSKNTS